MLDIILIPVYGLLFYIFGCAAIKAAEKMFPKAFNFLLDWAEAGWWYACTGQKKRPKKS